MKRLSLDRILQSQGIGSRKWCRELIADGEVVVDGIIVTDHSRMFDTQDFKFMLFAEEWLYREHVYIALNKPAGFECSRKPSHHPSVLTLLPDHLAWREVQAVGRLDFDTTGFLLLSDDGAFIHAQSSPKRHVPKLYSATTADPVSQELVDLLLSGVQLIDETAPLKALSCRAAGSHLLEIVLEQGKYHQVKRMLAAAGNHCASLHRSAIGGLRLVDLDLDEGEWRYLEPDELEMLVPTETGTAS